MCLAVNGTPPSDRPHAFCRDRRCARKLSGAGGRAWPTSARRASDDDRQSRRHGKRPARCAADDGRADGARCRARARQSRPLSDRPAAGEDGIMGPAGACAARQLAISDWLRTVPPTLSCFAIRSFSATQRPAHDEVYWLETVLPDGTVRMSSLEAIETAADGITQSLILCAHTHIARAVRLRDGRLIVNPGSVGSPRLSRRPSISRIVVEAGTPDARATRSSSSTRWHLARDVPATCPTITRRWPALARQNGQPELASALATGLDTLTTKRLAMSPAVPTITISRKPIRPQR
mgnify:CR=1 FL=1